MKMRLFSFLLTALLLLLSGCTNTLESQSKLMPISGSELTQTIPLSNSVDDVTDDDKFQAFVETWKLSGLFHEGLTMTAEQQNRFMEYFNQFDDIVRNYIILLLQGIAIGTVTVTDEYDNHEHGVYLNFCQFSLYDMNGDGFPEFILKTGSSEADYWYTVYTIIDGELIDCGGISGSHATLYIDGSGSFVRYSGQMGVYDITISILEGTKLVTQGIANGTFDFNKGEDYPELANYGYDDYDQYIEFSGIPTLSLTPAG